MTQDDPLNVQHLISQEQWSFQNETNISLLVEIQNQQIFQPLLHCPQFHTAYSRLWPALLTDHSAASSRGQVH